MLCDFVKSHFQLLRAISILQLVTDSSLYDIAVTAYVGKHFSIAVFQPIRVEVGSDGQ